MEEKIRAGDANQITRDYFEALLIEMRHIDAVIPDTSFALYGETFATPVMTAALSHMDKWIDGGMATIAKGAKDANAVMWAGMGDEDELKRMTETGAKTIKIIKPHIDNDDIYRQIEYAEKYGCLAVGMDVDHSFSRSGQYDVCVGFPLSQKTQAEIKQFVESTKLPFIIKGVLGVQDAVKCLEAGVSGIVVSHHHGILDYAIPPLVALPKILEAVGGKMEIFVDCCFETGYDVFKALALGATAVSIGRGFRNYDLNNGAEGITQAINLITAQLAGIMAKTCSPDIAHIEPSVIHKRTW